MGFGFGFGMWPSKNIAGRCLPFTKYHLKSAQERWKQLHRRRQSLRIYHLQLCDTFWNTSLKRVIPLRPTTYATLHSAYYRHRDGMHTYSAYFTCSRNHDVRSYFYERIMVRCWHNSSVIDTFFLERIRKIKYGIGVKVTKNLYLSVYTVQYYPSQAGIEMVDVLWIYRAIILKSRRSWQHMS